MLDFAKSYIPNPERTGLVAATNDDAVRCDVFRVEYKTPDDVNHEFISSLTIRCIPHIIQDKKVVIVGVFETLDEKIRTFIDTYLNKKVTLVFRQFNFDTGDTIEKKDHVCTLESARLPFLCDLPNLPATYELVFVEI